MDTQTIKKLNQLNQDFYQQTAECFSQTRQNPWHGWHNLLPFIEQIEKNKKDFKVLDLGCGNGRFGVFLKDHLDSSQFFYFGIDSSQELLNIANQQLSQEEINFKLEQIDLVSRLLDNKPIVENKFDLIVGFGLVHHLPGLQLRQKLFEVINKNLTDIGFGVLTLWQFGQKPRFKRKGVDPKNVGINPEMLDDNDYILDWQRGTKAYRYCHFVNQKEQERLVENSNLSLVNQFLADGKTNNLNKYLVLAKDNE
jgi:SAM-dependent methyltransferase